MIVFERIEQVLKSDIFLAFVAMAPLMALVFWMLSAGRPEQDRPESAPGPTDAPEAQGTALFRLQQSLGIEGLPAPVFVFAAVVWTVILVSLLAGLVALIWTVILHTVPEPAPAPFAAPEQPPTQPPVSQATGTVDAPAKATVWEYRFLLAQLAAVTTVLGAVVAFPVTLSRLRLTTEDNATKAAALYNDKINAALTDLHAQRQITEWKRGQGHIPLWQDDIVRRNGAIDRLESLAQENSDEAPRIARMLATYLRELSEAYPAKDPPAAAKPDALQTWAEGLARARSDMENAAQTLGRLRDVAGMTPETLIVDLHGANLQAHNLGGARMEGSDLFGARMEGANLFGARLEGANLFGARMEGANLFEAWMEGANLGGARMEGANLRGARMEGANLFGARMEGAYLGGARMDVSTNFSAADTSRAALKSVDLTDVALDAAQVKSMFGDGSVTLPDTIPRPAHWPAADLDWSDFHNEWTLWTSDPAAYIRPEDRPGEHD